MALSDGPSGSSVFIATVIFAVMASVSFGLRVWARLLISGWGTDDWLMLVGWKFYFFTGILYTFNTTIVKTSICFLMLRIAREKVHRLIFKGVICISSLSCFIRVVSWLARCKSIEDNWKEIAEYEPASCGSRNILTRVSIFFSTTCIITDIICAVLPAMIVWKLQMEWKTRVSVIIMLGMGVGASIVTMIRVKYLFTYEQQHDVLASMAPIALYSNLETALGIIAACIATMRPLLRYLPCVSGLTASGRSNRGPYQAHRMQRLEPRREARTERPDGVEGMDSQTLVLQFASSANAIDEEDPDIIVRRHDTVGESETVRHTLD